jgi:hypothetical protein
LAFNILTNKSKEYIESSSSTIILVLYKIQFEFHRLPFRVSSSQAGLRLIIIILIALEEVLGLHFDDFDGF